MLSGCEKVLCQLFNSGFTSAKALRWHMFKKLKGHQGVEKLLLRGAFRVGGSKELAVLYESYNTATFVIQHSHMLYR